jgi:inhibitor of KinA
MKEASVGEGASIDIPVAYGGAFGPDLEDVARFGQCSQDEVIARHTAVVYRVYLVGFVPGFAYMAEVDPRIAAPRRATPRTEVPAGSVAIAGGQTGIYPDVTPGGWNIIGRTPLLPFDVERAQPSLFKAGDRVSFRPITGSDFARLAAA